LNVKERYSKYAIKIWKGMSRMNMIGDNVKKFRKKKGLTQDNLARKADIPYTTLTELESNVVKKPPCSDSGEDCQSIRCQYRGLNKINLWQA